MTSPRSPVAPAKDEVIHLRASLPVAPADAFAWFTRNELLVRWLAPVADVEPWVGGRYELFWRPDEREYDSTIGCRVTALEHGEVVGFQWRSPRQFRDFANAADPLTHVLASFHPGEGGSRVHLVHTGWRSTPDWDEARRWQSRAWAVALAALGEALAGA